MPKIAGIEVETKLSLTGLIGASMAFIAMVGGWYKFDARVGNTEQAIVALQKQHEEELRVESKLDQTLNTTNQVMGAVVQALEDKGIHVRAHMPETADQ